ncbi:hypothetical protein CR513_15389, partial [Mucuna pruriens]
MASSNFNMEDLSPKSKLMEYLKKLEEKIEKLEVDTQEAKDHQAYASQITWGKLRRLQQQSHCSYQAFKDLMENFNQLLSISLERVDLSTKSRLMMGYMKKLEAKLEKLEDCLEFIKGKILPFSGNGNDDECYNWKLKVLQNLDCLDCDDFTNVRLIALSSEGYALIW